jgi:integrase
MYADIAATLSFYCGLRACEIKGLRWQDIDLRNRLLHVRRSKTPAGWRSPTLNATCLDVLQRLHDDAARLGFTEPDHFVFPWHGRGACAEGYVTLRVTKRGCGRASTQIC